jgi:AraC family transcriptional regulator
MFNKNVPKEYSKRINSVINFIVENSSDELTLDKLADIANYSPFHFQKIFKELIGESPKQFIIRIRLENAAHSLIVHRHLSITEIALDSGFSSPSTFARAFKNYFGISADKLRSLPHKEYVSIRKAINSKRPTHINLTKIRKAIIKDKTKISVTKISTIKVAFVNTSLTDTNKIQSSFEKLLHFADAHDIYTTNTKIIGIINPHSGIYQPSISLSPTQIIPKDTNTTEIKGGKFAVCKIKGDTNNIFEAFHYFYDNWLPKSAYRIRGHFAFEILTEDPLKKSYINLDRELYVPIEPI